MSEAAVQPVKERRPAKQVADPELIAMHEIVETLGELNEKSQSRVVMWMHDRWLSDESPTA
jgi:hypothetical protein